MVLLKKFLTISFNLCSFAGDPAVACVALKHLVFVFLTNDRRNIPMFARFNRGSGLSAGRATAGTPRAAYRKNKGRKFQKEAKALNQPAFRQNAEFFCQTAAGRIKSKACFFAPAAPDLKPNDMMAAVLRHAARRSEFVTPVDAELPRNNAQVKTK
jgi:hypothetical protein